MFAFDIIELWYFLVSKLLPIKVNYQYNSALEFVIVLGSMFKLIFYLLSTGGGTAIFWRF